MVIFICIYSGNPGHRSRLGAGSVHTGMLGEVCFQHDGAALQDDGEDKSFWPTDHLTLSSIYLLDLDNAENFGNPTPKNLSLGSILSLIFLYLTLQLCRL